jgi:hypothetical protein
MRNFPLALLVVPLASLACGVAPQHERASADALQAIATPLLLDETTSGSWIGYPTHERADVGPCVVVERGGPSFGLTEAPSRAVVLRCFDPRQALEHDDRARTLGKPASRRHELDSW